MRFISTDPEFTRSGTPFIVTAFTLTATAQGVTRVVRHKNLPRWERTIVRVLVGLLALPLGSGAGSVMEPVNADTFTGVGAEPIGAVDGA